MRWEGVIPAITTPFDADLRVDHALLRRHCQWMIENGCTGVVALGSLGEGATLTVDEKVAILESCVQALNGRQPVVAGISSLSTSEAVELAKEAERVGCQGLMVLPPYVYKGDWDEMRTHFEAVIASTGLSCMLYNNPIAYGTDALPLHIHELTRHGNLHAVKESSGDIRRVTWLRSLVQDRLAIFVGIDDLLVEGVAAGAVGWIAGLVNAFPRESVRLFELARDGQHDEARRLYGWFLPLLRLDTVPKFVQLIKFVQEEVGAGSARVRPPRLEINKSEAEETREILRQALEAHPEPKSTSFS